MPYTPRTANDILRELAARFVARSDISDISEGSVAAHLLYAYAEETANTELRLARIRDSFFLDSADGADLDDRVADLPPSGIVRLSASAASGGSLTLTRQDTDGDLTVLAGSTYGRTDDATLIYRQIADATFLDGNATTTAVAVVCLSTGTAGNCFANAIDRVISADGVTAVTNTLPLTNGRAQESDAALRARAKMYLSSLTGSTPTALEYLGLSFRASDNSRAAFARIYEDPITPGLAELLIDDGSSLSGYVREGAVTTGTVPEGGPPILYHETPAVNAIQFITINSGGVVRELAVNEFTSIPERGLVYVNDGVLSAGDTWVISKYNKWVGLPAELQAVIEGDVQDPLNFPGYRAAGCRVRVVAPQTTFVSFYVNVVPTYGRDLASVTSDVKNAIIQYMATLGPGETLFISRLIDRIMDNSDVLTVRFFSGDDVATAAADRSPATPRHVLRTTDAFISVVPLPQEV